MGAFERGDKTGYLKNGRESLHDGAENAPTSEGNHAYDCFVYMFAVRLEMIILSWFDDSWEEAHKVSETSSAGVNSGLRTAPHAE